MPKTTYALDLIENTVGSITENFFTVTATDQTTKQCVAVMRVTYNDEIVVEKALGLLRSFKSQNATRHEFVVDICAINVHEFEFQAAMLRAIADATNADDEFVTDAFERDEIAFTL